MRLLKVASFLIAAGIAMPVLAIRAAPIGNDQLLRQVNRTDGNQDLKKLVGRSVKLNMHPHLEGVWSLEKDQGVFVECKTKAADFQGGSVISQIEAVRPTEIGILVTLSHCEKATGGRQNR